MASRSTREDTPTFAANSELARFVDPDEKLSGGRIPSSVFMPNPGDKYLSVNSVELDSIQKIQKYYQARFLSGNGNAGVACRKISDFNSAARFSNIGVRADGNFGWIFYDDGSRIDAYRHRPVRTPPESHSHCGVEFMRAGLDDLVQRKFSRKLSGIRPHTSA